MPRPARPWFRCYTEVFADRKLRRLPLGQRYVWFAVMSAARESPKPGTLYDGANGVPMTTAGLADYAGAGVRVVAAALAAFEAADMIERLPDQAWKVSNWHKRQFETDDVTARTRKHREEDRNVPTLFQGTPDDSSRERSPSRALATETETETDPPPVSRSTNGGTRPQAVDNPWQGGGVDVGQAVQLAATRYARHQVASGRAGDEAGLARWWLQENDPGATTRGHQLLVTHDLSTTQLADALVAGNPSWLDVHRRPTAGGGDPDPGPSNEARIAELQALARERAAHPLASGGTAP